MLDHIDIGTTDYEKSRDFYVACLAALDIQLVMEIERQDGTAGAGFGRNDVPQFWLGEGSAVTGRLHVAFDADSRQTGTPHSYSTRMVTQLKQFVGLTSDCFWPLMTQSGHCSIGFL